MNSDLSSVDVSFDKDNLQSRSIQGRLFINSALKTFSGDEGLMNTSLNSSSLVFVDNKNKQVYNSKTVTFSEKKIIFQSELDNIERKSRSNSFSSQNSHQQQQVEQVNQKQNQVRAYDFLGQLNCKESDLFRNKNDSNTQQLEQSQIHDDQDEYQIQMQRDPTKEDEQYSQKYGNTQETQKTNLPRQSLQNFEKAANIINRVIGRSVNRVERINQHVKNFILFLKFRKTKRKLSDLAENEYKLLNDSTYFYSKIMQKKLLNRFLTQIYQFAKLKNPIPVFMPTDTLRIYWDIFQVIFTYSFIYIYSILMFFYQDDQDTNTIREYFKYTFIVFVLDVLINFNTAYFNKDMIIVNRKRIVWQYMSSNLFLTDAICLIVMGSKVIFQSVNLVYNPNNKLSIFAINMLIFLKLNGIQPKRVRFSYAFTLRENQKHIMRLFNQLFSVIAVAHVVSLAWYYLGIYEIQNGYKVSWLQKYDFVDLGYLEKYIYSLYWSITTMTTGTFMYTIKVINLFLFQYNKVGYGDISATNYVEAAFISLAMILFSCVFAYSVNNIGFILQEIEKSSKQLNDNITTIQRYLNRKNVNMQLQSRVRHYLSFLAEEQKDRNKQAENQIFKILSNKLRDEITIEINSRILKSYSLFSENFSPQTLRKLVFIMEEVLISPNEIIFEQDDYEDQSIYLIENGIIEIYLLHPPILQGKKFNNGNNKVHLLKQLTKNNLFGEISFFSGLSRKACARSINLSTLYKINRNKFIELIKENQEDLERFKMIEEQIKVQSDYSNIQIECYSCKQKDHIASNCPKIHQIFDSQFIILKNNFSLFQNRNYQTKRREKAKKYNPRVQFKDNQSICSLLKSNLRDFNSQTELMFKTELDLYNHNQNREKSESDYESSSEFSSKNSDLDQKRNSFQSDISVCSQKKQRQLEKQKSIKKVRSKKKIGGYGKSQKQLNKEDSQLSLTNNIEVDNLETIISSDKNQFKSQPYFKTKSISSNLNNSYKDFDQFENVQRDSLDRNERDKESQNSSIQSNLEPYNRPTINPKLQLNSVSVDPENNSQLESQVKKQRKKTKKLTIQIQIVNQNANINSDAQQINNINNQYNSQVDPNQQEFSPSEGNYYNNNSDSPQTSQHNKKFLLQNNNNPQQQIKNLNGASLKFVDAKDFQEDKNVKTIEVDLSQQKHGTILNQNDIQEILNQIIRAQGGQNLENVKYQNEDKPEDIIQTNNYLNMDYFEMIKEYKKFFPHNNFSSIFSKFKFNKLLALKKFQVDKNQISFSKIKRKNVFFKFSVFRKSLFFSALLQKLNKSDVNLDSYKPTFLSYGVSQKSESIYPKMLQPLGKQLQN